MNSRSIKFGSAFTQDFADLPNTLPIFPLPGAVILPGGELPLNIFEPRYLNMVQDAMSTHRLVGMIQPSDQKDNPTLHPVGCAGRIIRYAETEDKRFEILLSGVCRFRIAEEFSTMRGYRLVRPDWQAFSSDYELAAVPQGDLERFREVLRTYLERKGMQADWDRLGQFSAEELTGTLISALPLSISDKQLLLEAPSVAERVVGFTSMLLRDESPDQLLH